MNDKTSNMMIDAAVALTLIGLIAGGYLYKNHSFTMPDHLIKDTPLQRAYQQAQKTSKDPDEQYIAVSVDKKDPANVLHANETFQSNVQSDKDLGTLFEVVGIAGLVYQGIGLAMRCRKIKPAPVPNI